MVNGQQAWRMLALVGLAELLGMTPWFSASAVSSAIVAEYHLTSAQAAWLTMAVQGGFVAGTLVSALLNLSDLVNARWVFAHRLRRRGGGQRPRDRGAVAGRSGGLALRDGHRARPRLSAGHEDRRRLVQRRRGAALGILVGVAHARQGAAVPARGRLRRGLAIDDAPGSSWLAAAGGLVAVADGAGRPPRDRLARRSIPERPFACSPGAARGSASSAISATCGSSTPCGPGSAST